MEKPKRTGSASAGLESGSRSEATCSKGGPIYSTGTDTDVGGQTGEDEYIRWRTLAWFLRCAALSLLLAASEGPRKTDRRRRADRSKTQGMHARLSGCAEERGRGTWAEAGSSSAIGRLSLGGAEARGRGPRGAARWGRCASSSGDRSASLSGKRRETILPAETRAPSRPAPPSTSHRYTHSGPIRTSPSTYINVITGHEPPQSAPSLLRFFLSSRPPPQSPSTSTSRESARFLLSLPSSASAFCQCHGFPHAPERLR